jgi:alkyl sulfatase BDS1-like metallo-beta-lactamase superfamily hydrolase
MLRNGMLDESALRMINKGYALDEVADNLGVPLEWVQKLAEQELATA